MILTDKDLPAEGSDRLSRAVRLLLLLSRIDFPAGKKQLILEEFKSFTAWKLFAALAVRHGVAALVWQNICDLGLAGSVPETERTMLEGLRFKAIARVSWISEAAAGVSALLESEGIKVVMLKGLALEHTVYGSRGLRQMSDADLLVAPSDALRARDILIAAGFGSMPLKSPLYRHIILDLGNHLPELHRGGISVDLHFRLFGPEGEEMVVKAIEQSATVTAGGATLRVLPPVTSFLALVSHIYKHEIKGEFQLRLWTDIYLMLEKYRDEILTPGLPSAAEEAGIPAETRIVLTVMARVWGVAVPDEMKAHSQDEEERAGMFMNHLTHPGAVEPIGQKEMFRRNLKSLSGARKKIIFILGDVFPSVRFMKKRYGCRSNLAAMFYYPHRMGKLFWILALLMAKNHEN